MRSHFLQIALSSLWLPLDGRKIFEVELTFRKIMLTLNDSDAINVFKSARIKIFTSLSTFSAGILHWYSHYSKISRELDKLELPTIISSVVEYLVIFSLVLNCLPLVSLDCMITYMLKHLEYQMKILEVLVKQIPTSLGSKDTMFDEEIKERLNICIVQNLNVRR